ncbi:hypothetical protein BB558_000950 [Smittium angustum]|uniref:Protein kinase domain-containing protein n=1 Tax=Smittium angustum TaxID=133377 RepID=A0A2U1JD30_SMIAN|nr:hypothetical protein BB558_000950 [Smittium angustum]
MNYPNPLFWSQNQVQAWLHSLGFAKYAKTFADNKINGEALLELNYLYLAQLDIKTIGDRVKIDAAISKLRHDHFQLSKLYIPPDNFPKNPNPRKPPFNNHNYYSQQDSPLDNNYPKKYFYPDSQNDSTNLGKYTPHFKPQPSPLQFSDPNFRPDLRPPFITRVFSESTNTLEFSAASLNNNSSEHNLSQPSSALINHNPSFFDDHLRNLNKPPEQDFKKLEPSDSNQEKKFENEPEPNNPLMSTIAVSGPNNEKKYIPTTASESGKDILYIILGAFGLMGDKDKDRYALFLVSGEKEGARMLSNEELFEMCKSNKLLGKEKFFLKKRHQLTLAPPSAQRDAELQRAIEKLETSLPPPPHSKLPHVYNSYTVRKQHNIDTLNQQPKLPFYMFDSVASPFSIKGSGSAEKIFSFFGQRPPSEQVHRNLEMFFPGNEVKARNSIIRSHMKNVLKKSGKDDYMFSSKSSLNNQINLNTISPMKDIWFESNNSKTPNPYKPNTTKYHEDTSNPNLINNFDLSDSSSFLSSRESTSAFDYKSIIQSNFNTESPQLQFDVMEKISNSNPSKDKLPLDSDDIVPNFQNLRVNISAGIDPHTDESKHIQPRESSMLKRRSASDLNQIETTFSQHLPTANNSLNTNAFKDTLDVSHNLFEQPGVKNWIKGAPIASGSFGSVFYGIHTQTGIIMAVKQVDLPSADIHTDPRKHKMVKALKSEIELLRTFQHRNIVRYLGCESSLESLFIFLEYVPGGSVASALASFGLFPESLVRFYISQTLEGLVYLHGKNVIHCDIKGGNILIDNSGMVKISDFGISKKVDDMISYSNHRASLQGSVFWMAPEIVKDSRYTIKCDIWSLGCLVIEMLTGKHPYPEYDQLQALLKIGQKNKPTIPTNISDDTKDFIEKCLAIDIDERPTAELLLEHPFIKNSFHSDNPHSAHKSSEQEQ